MKLIGKPYSKTEHYHILEYNEIEYIREECLIKNSAWTDKDGNHLHLHTIKWSILKPNNEFEEHGKMVAYYSLDIGWSKNGKLDKNNPTPKIETIFQNLKK